VKYRVLDDTDTVQDGDLLKVENTASDSIPINPVFPLWLGKKYNANMGTLVRPLKEVSDEQIQEAADKWVFETNGHRWSNNNDSAGDNYGSFIAGAKWVQENIESTSELRSALSDLESAWNSASTIQGMRMPPTLSTAIVKAIRELHRTNRKKKV